jgi:hypothetical protein
LERQKQVISSDGPEPRQFDPPRAIALIRANSLRNLMFAKEIPAPSLLDQPTHGTVDKLAGVAGGLDKDTTVGIS